MYCGVNSVGEGNESVWRFRAIETFTHTPLYSPLLPSLSLLSSLLLSFPLPSLPLYFSLPLFSLSSYPSLFQSRHQLLKVISFPPPVSPFSPPPHSIICIHIIIVGLPRHRCVWQWRSEEVRSPRRYQSYSLLSLSGYQTSFWEEIEG